MKWFRKHTNDSPRLISLSPLRHSDQIDDSILSYYNHRNLNENDTSSTSSLPQTPVSNKSSRNYCIIPPSPPPPPLTTIAAAAALPSQSLPTSKSSTLSSTSSNDSVSLRKSRIGNYFPFYFNFILFLILIFFVVRLFQIVVCL